MPRSASSAMSDRSSRILAIIPPPCYRLPGKIIGDAGFLATFGFGVAVGHLQALASGWMTCSNPAMSNSAVMALSECGVASMNSRSPPYSSFANGMTYRVEQLERQAADAKPQADRLTRVEVRLDNVVDGISEIKALLRPPIIKAPNN